MTLSDLNGRKIERGRLQTTFDTKLLNKLKHIALERGLNLNELLEEISRSSLSTPPPTCQPLSDQKSQKIKRSRLDTTFDAKLLIEMKHVALDMNLKLNKLLECFCKTYLSSQKP